MDHRIRSVGCSIVDEECDNARAAKQDEEAEIGEGAIQPAKKSRLCFGKWSSVESTYDP